MGASSIRPFSSSLFSTPRRRRALRLATFSVGVLGFVHSEQEAHAAGLYVADHGVRPLARGGAFVAGADDLGAIWYNPAGLTDAPNAFLVQASFLNYSTRFSRQAQTTDASGAQRIVEFPSVEGTTRPIPIPTLAGSLGFGSERPWVIAASVLVPTAAVTTYPTVVSGQPAASRYSLVSMTGSLLLVPGLQAAVRPVPWLQVGAGVNAFMGQFASEVVLNANPSDRLLSAPEDPTYDATTRLKAGFIVAPSANAGIIVIPDPRVRVGLSAQYKFSVDAPGTVDVRLPSASPFDRATQAGRDVRVRFDLPAILRAGVEVRPLADPKALRIELAYVREFWSAHSTIDVDTSQLKLLDITGFPSPFNVLPMAVPRNFKDTNSLRLGGEFRQEIGEMAFDFRGGVAVEEGAIPKAYLSPMTMDFDKLLVAVGVGAHLGQGFRLDATVALPLTQDTYVPPAEAAVPRLNPVKGNPTAPQAINGGTYHAEAQVFGVGLHYTY